MRRYGAALDRRRQRSLGRFAPPSHGARAPRRRAREQLLERVDLPLDDVELREDVLT